ncbi:copper homeostasis protein CutC [Sanyastnella coralliicola]|uniref:copper homeostasis protein CutC n=1 Tax=Sanyastnella coralliicola TaxID=3069118 RepID=UPI0027BA070D|nr:copper homeostasis protein CutC [Longitalea sp. SCSIO 12813]
MLLEVVCPGVPALENALQGGAQRIELCSDLSCGGITPSPGLTKLALEISGVPVFPLLRAREGDFVYSENEKKAMLYDIAAMADLGVHGVVVGSLTPALDLDLAFVEAAKKAAGDLPITFHRAFDVCNDFKQAAKDLYDLGYGRILTAGQAPRAAEGLDTLRELVALKERPMILAGGSIRLEQIDDLLEVGVDEIHTAAGTTEEGVYSRGFFAPGYTSVDSGVVRAMIERLETKEI